MERHEYEKLVAILKALEGVIDWRSYFGDKMTKVNNEEKKIVDVMEQLIAAGSYDKLDKNLKGYDEWVDDVNKSVTNMQQIAKFYGAKISADHTVEKLPDVNEVRKDEADLDKSFFDRMAKTMAKARKDSWKNSSHFDKMEESLGKLNDLINGESNLSEEERDKQLYDALDELEKTTDRYLEHKVKRGVNENAVAKVEAATSMKEYIKERKSEIFRRQLEKDTKYSLYNHGMESKYTDYAIKGAEIATTRSRFTELAEKLNISSEKLKEMNNVFANAEHMMHIGDEGFEPKDVEKVDTRAYAAAFLTSEFMRNELLTSGGEVTPMMKQFMAEPEAFRRTLAETGIVLWELRNNNGGFDKENVDEFASRSANANVLDSYAKSDKKQSVLHSKMLFDSILSVSTNKIQEEKEALARQNAEKAEREKVEFDELKKQEKAKGISDKYKENLKLARSYAGLAKFAREHLSGTEWEERIAECTKLAKEYQEKAMFGDNGKEIVEEKKTEKVRSSEKSQNKTL